MHRPRRDIYIYGIHIRGEEFKLIQRHTAWKRFQETSTSLAATAIDSDCDSDALNISIEAPPSSEVSDSVVTVQMQIDDRLIKLLFNGGNVLVSPSVHYDPTVRLV